MSGKADYRKMNDRSQSSSTYHKKDGTNGRAIMKMKLHKALQKKRAEQAEIIR